MNINTKFTFSILTCVLWCLNSPIEAQTQPSAWEKQISFFQKAEGKAEKEAKIKEFSDKIIAELNQGREIDLNDSSSLKQLKSKDSKINLYYFLTEPKTQSRQIEMFVAYKRNGKQKVVHLSDELTPIVSGRPNAIKPVLNCVLTEKTVKTDTLYQFSAHEGNHVPLEPIVDLYLKCLFEEMALTTDDAEKMEINGEILKRIALVWNDPTTFDNPLKCFNRLSVLISADKKVKLFTWNTPMADGTHKFWGAICTRQNASEVVAQPLIDKTDEIRIPERAALSPKKWYGAIYYDIVETVFKDQKYYTLLGFKGNSEFTKIKVIDVFTVSANNEVKFNSAIVGKSNGFVPRAVFEYSIQANMMLKYDANHDMIVMDNLGPSAPQYKEIYTYYGPDFSYNGLKFEKGKWVFYPDIDLRNPKTK